MQLASWGSVVLELGLCTWRGCCCCRNQDACLLLGNSCSQYVRINNKPTQQYADQTPNQLLPSDSGGNFLSSHDSGPSAVLRVLTSSSTSSPSPSPPLLHLSFSSPSRPYPHLSRNLHSRFVPLPQITVYITLHLRFLRFYAGLCHFIYTGSRASTFSNIRSCRLFTAFQIITRKPPDIPCAKPAMKFTVPRSLALHLLLSISFLNFTIASPAYEWPTGVDPSVKYWPPGTGPPSKRWLQEFAEAYELNHTSARCPAARKMSAENPGEKFYWDWEHEARSQQGFLGLDTFVEEKLEDVLAELPANAFRAPHRNVAFDYGIIGVLLGKRQTYQCATGSYACTAIGVPGSCCAMNETCEKIPDIGYGNVGCCPSGLLPPSMGNRVQYAHQCYYHSFRSDLYWQPQWLRYRQNNLFKLPRWWVLYRRLPMFPQRLYPAIGFLRYPHLSSNHLLLRFLCLSHQRCRRMLSFWSSVRSF